MEKTYKDCQSCGMPLAKDEGRGGTEADGSKSSRFCSHCYQNGKFTEPNITMTEMQAKAKGKIQSMGFPGFLATFFTKNVPHLERWNSK